MWLREGTFGSFPLELCRGLEPGLQLVLIYICNYANKTGKAWPSVATLCRDTAMGRRTVQRHIKELIGRGILVKQTRARDNGSQTTNCYMVRIPDNEVSDLAPPPCQNVPPHNKLSRTSKDTNVSLSPSQNPPPIDKRGIVEVSGDEEPINYKAFFEIWDKALGKPSFSRMTNAIKPVAREIGQEQTEACLRLYCEKEADNQNGRFANPEKFAQTFRTYLRKTDVGKNDLERYKDNLLKYVKLD